jgi:hypothetical protein
MDFEPCQGLFSFAQEVWAKGKDLPILDVILNAIGATTSQIISSAFHSDLKAIEIGPHLQSADERCCVIVDSVIFHFVSLFEALFGSSNEQRAVPQLGTSDLIATNFQLVQDALAFKHLPESSTDDLSNSSESPSSKAIVARKKTDNRVKHKRFSLLSPKRRHRSMKKQKRDSAIQKHKTNIVPADLSPVKSEQGETILIKEAIKYISSEDFSDVTGTRAD